MKVMWARVRFYSVYCLDVCIFFFFKQKTAYEMRISDWSSDVCSSDLRYANIGQQHLAAQIFARQQDVSRLFPEKCNRKLGRRGITQNGAAGTIQAAGQVNRTDGNVAALERGNELGARTMQWTGEIGRAHVGTPVTNAKLVCRVLIE